MRLKFILATLASMLMIHMAIEAQPIVPVADSLEARAQAETGFIGSQAESADSLMLLMRQYDGRPGVSLMKFGKMAMTMGKTVGRAGDAWTRKVAGAFKKVSSVYMLDYGEAPEALRDEIDSAAGRFIIKDNLVLTNRIGPEISDETFGEVSQDGKHVSDLVILMYGQSLVCIKGKVLASDVDRIVRRLNKQL